MATQSVLIGNEVNRATVVNLLFNHEGKVLIGHSIRHNAWQLPQGGIKISEHPFRAAWREVGEELGTKCRSLKPVVASTIFPAYRFPENDPHEWYQAVRLGCQAFLLREDEKFVLSDPTKKRKPEFDATAFIDLTEITSIAQAHKVNAYREISTLFAPVAFGIPAYGRISQRDRDIACELRRTATDFSGRFTPTLQSFPGKPIPRLVSRAAELEAA